MKAIRIMYVAFLLTLGALFAVSLVWILMIILAGKTFQHDDTDPPGGRSGIGLKIDYKTGCQYLTYGMSITPRLDIDGRQICTPVRGE